MNLTISTQQLLSGLLTVQPAIDTRSTLLILSNALLRCEGDELTITGTDLDTTISCKIGCAGKTNRSGSVTVPLRRLLALVQRCDAKEVALSANEPSVLKIGADGFVQLNGLLYPDEFPPTLKMNEPASVNIPKGVLKDMLIKTSFAMSADESRYVLCGVSFALADKQLIGVATDGRRIVVVNEPLESDASTAFIVPRRAVKQLMKLLSATGNVAVEVKDHWARFSFSEPEPEPLIITFTTKTIDGDYPKWKQIIPSEFKGRVFVDRAAFAHAIHRSCSLSTDKDNCVTLTLSKNNLEIFSKTSIGHSRENIAVNYRDNDFSIIIHSPFLVEALDVLTHDEIVLEFADQLTPLTLRDCANFLYVVMPMRLR